jgi:hypothetical protein
VGDAEDLKGPSHLPVLFLGRRVTRLGRTAEVAAPNRCKARRNARSGASHNLQRLKGRGPTLLLHEAGVQDAPVGIIEGHHEVPHRQPRNPPVGRAIEVDEHANHRPAFPLAAVLATPRRLRHHPGLLQHQPGPVVRELKAVLLDRLLVEVANREVRIHLPLEPAKLPDHLHRNPPPPLRPCPAPVQKLLRTRPPPPLGASASCAVASRPGSQPPGST